MIEDLAREEGKYKAVEVKYDYMEDLAQRKLEEATAAVVKAAEESKKLFRMAGGSIAKDGERKARVLQ